MPETPIPKLPDLRRLSTWITQSQLVLGPCRCNIHQATFFLNGIQTPYMETKQGWTVDGVEYKVRIDAGAKAMDWRGLVKNAGA